MFKATVNSKQQLPVAENLINQNINIEKTAPFGFPILSMYRQKLAVSGHACVKDMLAWQ